MSGSYTAFQGFRRLARGPLAEVALAVKTARESGAAEEILTFDDTTGGVRDLFLEGGRDEIVAWANAAGLEVAKAASEPRGPGRPRLGVVGREVTLLPRHWDWLAGQPGGASVALRRLVDEARRTQAPAQQARLAQERAYRFLSALAGDLPGFEEATRALFAGNPAGFSRETENWPADLRAYARQLAEGGEPPEPRPAAAADPRLRNSGADPAFGPIAACRKAGEP